MKSSVKISRGQVANVFKEYETIALLTADQENQSSNRIYKVIDASADPNITFSSGETRKHAYYEYKETANGVIGDYTLIGAPFADGGSGGGGGGGVQSVTGDGVSGTPEDVVLTYPTPAEIGAIEDAPSDGKVYGRKDAAWEEIGQVGGGDMLASMYDPTGVQGDAFDFTNLHSVPPFLEDAPSDGKQYARKDANWDEIVIPSSGVQSVTGDGVGGTPEDVVMTFPTPAEIGAQEQFTTDESLYLDPITKVLRANLTTTIDTFDYTSGVQEFTLTETPIRMLYIWVQGVGLVKKNVQYEVDEVNKKLTILDELQGGEVITACYHNVINESITPFVTDVQVENKDLDDFKNESADPYVRFSEIPSGGGGGVAKERIKTSTAVTGTYAIDLLENYGLYKLELTGDTDITFSGTDDDNYRVIGIEITGGKTFTVPPNVQYYGSVPLSNGIYQFQLTKNTTNWEGKLYKIDELNNTKKTGYRVASFNANSVSKGTSEAIVIAAYSETVINESLITLSDGVGLKIEESGKYIVSAAAQNIIGPTIEDFNDPALIEDVELKINDRRVALILYKGPGLSESQLTMVASNGITGLGGNLVVRALDLVKDEYLALALADFTGVGTEFSFEKVSITIEKIDG